jgi:putative membrane protein
MEQQPFLTRLVIHAFALWFAASSVDGVAFSGGGDPQFFDVVFVALLFGVVNALVKPFVQLVTCGLYVLTLGLFTFIVNAMMLEFTGWLAGDMLVVDDFWSAFKGALVISLVSTVLSWMFDPPRPPDDDQGPRRRTPPGVIDGEYERG